MNPEAGAPPNEAAPSSSMPDDVFSGGGEMGALMRSIDWSRTPVGPVERWPQSLKTALSILLTQRTACFIFWGPEHVQFYNDAYRPILGTQKHPAAMGQRGVECWPEIWEIIEPMLEAVHAGESTGVNDGLLVIDRHGYLEEGYYNYTFSPIRDESGAIGGVFCVVYDTTQRVIGERRLRTLRDLAAHGSTAKTAEEACQAAAETLAANSYDVPFAALYLFDADRRDAVLVSTSGTVAGSPAAPQRIPMEGNDLPAVARAAATGRIEFIENLAEETGPLPGGPWPAGAESAIVLPILLPGQSLATGFVVAGISPRKRLDQSYRTFYELVGAQIAAVVADARAYEEERKRAEWLAELDRAKTTFFSNVSHEFRTPLTLMLGPLQGLMENTAAGAPRQELELIYRNGLRLLKLVNTLLDFARLEAGRLKAAFSPTDLSTLTADLASVFRSAIEKAGLALQIDCPPLPEPVWVDREMWEKIVLNLLSNAFKFTFEGSIRVALRAADGTVELLVEDSGTGIPEAELPHIFERFHSGGGSRGRTHEGTGIGLALVQELVKLHSGAVQVESKVGKGTCFTVSIPSGYNHLSPDQMKPDLSPPPVELAARPYVEEALRWLPEPAPSREETGSAQWAFAESERTSGARILVADDNADMRDYLRRLLSGLYQVSCVEDGAAALEAIRKDPPDLILTDIMMPRLDGFGLLANLRADQETATIPVVLLSARAGEEARIEGLEAGADDYVVKPFGARELLARIASRLEIARLRMDVTQREKELRVAAEEERERWYELIRKAPAAIALVRGPDHLYELVNAEYLLATGRKRAEDLLGRSVRDVFPEIESQGFLDVLDDIYRTGEPYFGNEKMVRLDRTGDGNLEERYFNFILQPTRDSEGNVDGVMTHAVDVTEQMQSRRRVEDSERQLRTLADSIPQLVWMAEPDGHIFWYNRRWYEYTGTTPDQMLGWGWKQVHDPAILPAVIERWKVSLQTGEPFEMEFPLKGADGIYRWFLTRVSPLRTAEGDVWRWFGTNTDVTDLRLAQEALKKSETQFRHLADSMPQIVWTADDSGRWTYSNQRWYQHCGATEAAGVPELLPLLHPADTEKWTKTWSTAVQQRNRFELECRMRDPQTGDYRWQLARAVPVELEHSRTQWYGTLTDLEEQKAAEEALRQRQKLESIGLLAGGIAHDFNNLLVGIMGNASILQEVLEKHPDRHLLDDLIDASERAADLTRQMLAYAGQGAFTLVRLDLSTSVRDTANLLRATVLKKARIEMELSADLPPIEADPGQVQQVAMNLIINASEAVSEGANGLIRVVTRTVHLSSDSAIQFHPARPAPGTYVVLEVSDNGCGIPSILLNSIFDPFFTTKFTGRGLGLAAVLGILRSRGGAIAVQTEEGVGSAFSAYFPVAGAQEDPAEQAAGTPDRPQRPVVLIVDDEAIVRRAACHVVEKCGFEAVPASNGQEAVDWFAANPDEVALILLDLTMPVMDGKVALQELQRMRPGVPIVLTSGFTESEATARFEGRGLAGFIQKPYTADRLKALLQEILVKSGSPGSE